MVSSVLESKIQTNIKNAFKRRGWLCYKFSSPAQRGVPDLICIGEGRAVFIEVKQPGKRPTKQQILHLKRLRGQGVAAGFVTNVDEALDLAGLA